MGDGRHYPTERDELRVEDVHTNLGAPTAGPGSRPADLRHPNRHTKFASPSLSNWRWQQPHRRTCHNLSRTANGWPCQLSVFGIFLRARNSYLFQSTIQSCWHGRDIAQRRLKPPACCQRNPEDCSHTINSRIAKCKRFLSAENFTKLLGWSDNAMSTLLLHIRCREAESHLFYKSAAASISQTCPIWLTEICNCNRRLVHHVAQAQECSDLDGIRWRGIYAVV
jgi:hypothetical protein